MVVARHTKVKVKAESAPKKTNYFTVSEDFVLESLLDHADDIEEEEGTATLSSR
jgi:hypothetical protein